MSDYKKKHGRASPSKINLYPSKNAFYPSKIRVDGSVDESMLPQFSVIPTLWSQAAGLWLL